MCNLTFWTCVYSFVYARITLNSTPSLRGLMDTGNVWARDVLFAQSPSPMRMDDVFLTVLLFRSYFFQTLRTTCAHYTFASRTEPGQKKNDKKKPIPLGGDKNVNDILYTDMRTRLYIYIT